MMVPKVRKYVKQMVEELLHKGCRYSSTLLLIGVLYPMVYWFSLNNRKGLSIHNWHLQELMFTKLYVGLTEYDRQKEIEEIDGQT